MTELKTKQTDASVEAFITAIPNEQARDDCRTLVQLMQQATRAEPRMWGPSIVGFGDFHYRYATGREGDWFQIGFSPRKQALTLYIMCGFGRDDELLAKLGTYKTGKACLYVKRLSDLHLPTLKKLLQLGVREMRVAQKQMAASQPASKTTSKPARKKPARGK